MKARACVVGLCLSMLFAAAAGADSGTRLAAAPGIRHTTSALMQQPRARLASVPHPRPQLSLPNHRAENSSAEAGRISTPRTEAARPRLDPKALIHTNDIAFDGATLADTSTFPPDTMGAPGPTQFVVFVNGRLRSFTKDGAADGVLDLDPDVFFASVMTPVVAPAINTTTFPQVRFDRFSARWFLTAVDFPCTTAACTATPGNRVLLAVSDAASSGTISPATVWTFFFFDTEAGAALLQEPSLGIDVNALYIGGNVHDADLDWVATNGYVVQKTSVLGPGPLVVTMFADLVTGVNAGPLTPRGVDNFDPGATEGYFVGSDNAAFSRLMFRRVSDPGTLTPSISGNIVVNVQSTSFPDPVDHTGNTGGADGQLNTLDDRLYAAMIRNGRMWTAHNFRVTAAGTSTFNAPEARNAVRRYEFEDLTTTPAVAQVGTVFDDAATRAASRQYFIPTITATGQGHAVVGFTMAGSVGATPAYTGRLAGDPAGTMAGPPALPATTFGTTTANYNPPVVPGSPRPWGRQSFTVVDPIDDMTVWTIQEYNQALNSYAVRVGRLNAPPPATPTCSGAALAFPGPTGNVVIAGTSMNGSGFYDPGANLPAPALPFAHIGATVTNAIVNSITYDSPTQVTLNITTLTTGLHDVTITNPDGQSVTGNGCIDAAAASSADLTLTKSDNGATVAAGGTVAYALTYGNAGDLDATNVTLNETVPTNTTFNAGASTPGWSCVPNDDPPSTCTLALGSVAAGVANQNATFAVTVDDPLPGGVTQISNTATISDDGTHGADPTPANNSASDMTTISGLPSVSGTKTVAGTFAVGSNVTYTIVLTNNGTGTQQDNAGNEFSDILPPEVTLVSANATNGAAVATVLTNTVTWNGALTAGASVTITITAVIEPVAVGTIITNQGTIAFDANGDATNESTAPTDDPSVGGATDATSFTVTAATVPGIPTLSVLGMALLIGLSLIAGVVLLKR